MSSSVPVIKMKRTFDEIENQLPLKKLEAPTESSRHPQCHQVYQYHYPSQHSQHQQQHPPNKRARFIDIAPSSIFISPITPSGRDEIFVPDTPVKSRTPLGDYDSNTNKSHLGKDFL